MTVGVASVLVLTALGEGARRYVTSEFSSLGSNLLIVIPGKNETTGGFPGVGGAPNDLTLDDARVLQRGVAEAALVVPITVGSETVSHRERRRQVLVFGATRDFLAARELRVGAGQFLPPDEMDRGTSVVVIGAKVATELFGDENPLGRVVRIGDWRTRTIGVLEQRGQQVGLNIDEIVIIPVASAMRLFDTSSLFQILLKIKAYADLDVATRDARRLLLNSSLKSTGVYLCRKGNHYHVTSDPRSGWVRKLELEGAR